MGYIKTGQTCKATKKGILLVTYNCSKCNSYNEFIHEIVGEGESSTTFGTFEKVRQEACDRASANLEAQLASIESDIESGSYVYANFKHHCSHCGHVEPWACDSTMDGFKKSDKLITTIAGIEIFAGIVMLFIKPLIGGILFGGAFLLILLGSIAAESVLDQGRNNARERCKDLPTSALPRIRRFM